MAYAAWSVTFGEQPTASKWNILGTNDASFNDGTGIAAGAIVGTHFDANVAAGWITANETWTYASASTFTISGDKTSKYSVGMKIKFTQTSVKYFYITAISYSAPNTTVTVNGGASYTVANAAITANYYSFGKAPQGFPEGMLLPDYATPKASDYQDTAGNNSTVNEPLIQYGKKGVSVTSAAQFKEIVITLPVAYADANYSISISFAEYTTGSVLLRDLRVKSGRSTTTFTATFTCDTYGATTTVYVDWMTIGKKTR
jgi:hypothetical protein